MSFTVARTDLKKAVEVVEPVAISIGAMAVTTDDSLSKVSIVGSGCRIHRATLPVCSGPWRRTVSIST